MILVVILFYCDDDNIILLALGVVSWVGGFPCDLCE